MRARSWGGALTRLVVRAVAVPDLRMPLVGAAAWVGALAGLAWPTDRRGSAAWVAAGLLGAVATALARAAEGRRGRPACGIGWRLLAALLLVATATGYAAAVRVDRVADNPVASLASGLGYGKIHA